MALPPYGLIRVPAPGRRFVLLFGLGLLLRLLLIATPGTFDTNEWKAWSGCSARDGLRGVYGPPDRKILRLAERVGAGDTLRGLRSLRFPRFGCEWQGRTTFVDYPPASVVLLWAVGRLYAAFDPSLSDSLVFGALLNVLPLVACLAMARLLLGSAEDARLAQERAAALWWNPALLLAAPVLGYQDPVFGVFGLATVLALMRRRYVPAAAALAACGLLKPQGVLLVPVFVLVLLREADARTWLRCLLVGLGLGAVATAPWWTTGHALSCLAGLARPLTDPDLAPLGLNLWWLAGCVLQWLDAGPWPQVSIVKIAAFEQRAGFDPQPLAALLVLAGSVLALRHLARSAPADRAAIPRALILQVHVYAFLALRVHENHALLALFVAPLLLGRPLGRRALVALSALAFVNLLLAVRNGESVALREAVLALPGLPVADAFFAATAAAHGLLLAWLFVACGRAERERSPLAHSA